MIDAAVAEGVRLGSQPTAHQVAEAEAEAAAEPEAAAVVRFNPHVVPGDPSPAQFAALSTAQQLELEGVRPGVGERLRRAAQWDATSDAHEAREAEAAAQAEHAQRMQTDEAYREAQLREAAAQELATRWLWISDAEKLALRERAGMSDEAFAQLAQQEAAYADRIRRGASTPGGVF